MSQPLLAGQALTITIPGRALCQNLDLAIAPGEVWGILGPNGAGKTTLLHVLAGLRRPQDGTVWLRSEPVAGLSRRHIAQSVGVLFQATDESFPSTVLETALIGRHPHVGSWWRGEDSGDIDKARAALKAVELEDLEQRLVDTLSGGERRRTALATVLAQDPEIYLLDEPTNHLDLRHQMGIMEYIVAEVRQRDKAAVLCLHDANLAARYCDRVLLMQGTGHTQQGPAMELLDEHRLEALYDYPFITVDTPRGPAYLPR